MADQFCVRSSLSSGVDAALTSTASCGVVFGVACLERYKATRAFKLGVDATLVMTEPNAGGQSEVSEAMSMEYMHQLFGAVDVVTEMQIEYWSPNWKKVDYLCTIRGERVAVSVTRAMAFQGAPFDAARLLRKKMRGLVVAKTGVSRRQRYSKSVLHIWCQTTEIAMALSECYAQVADELGVTENVILIATVAATEACIFTNDASAIEVTRN
ncbi:unnamed protein product [Aphanomyces euteiches]